MTLPEKGETSYSFPLQFLGVQVDGFRRDNGEAPEGFFAIPAKNFVEMRLLSRTVEVRVEHVDPSSGRLYGSVYHPRGLMSQFLLAEGLAKLGTMLEKVEDP